MSGWKYEPGVIFDHVEFNTKIVMAISMGLVSLLLSRKSNFLDISSCTEYVLFYPYLLKGSLISERILTLVPLPTKNAKLLS